MLAFPTALSPGLLLPTATVRGAPAGRRASVVRMDVAADIKADLTALIEEKGCGPLMIRLSWHDAGVYSNGKLKGGCPNAAMRFTDGGEGTFGANAGLPDVAVGLLEPIATKYEGKISNAAQWALAANVGIEVMGGPVIPTQFGRVDAESSAESVESQEGRLPDGDKGVDHLREIFHPKGFDDKDIVALSGAHTVGGCKAERSGFEGDWTENKLSFDNTCMRPRLEPLSASLRLTSVRVPAATDFSEMLKKEYVLGKASTGEPQYMHEASGTIMLISDLALLEDDKFRPFVEKYAEDQEAYFADFTDAWVRLQENGVAELRKRL